jgi:hypothetical protein
LKLRDVKAEQDFHEECWAEVRALYEADNLETVLIIAKPKDSSNYLCKHWAPNGFSIMEFIGILQVTLTRITHNAIERIVVPRG